MTPKDKAKELIDKFNFSIDHNTKVYTIYQIPDESKRCALIAVDEVINVAPNDKSIYGTDYLTVKEYWQRVKQEIENL